MTTVWRLAEARFADAMFSGEGAAGLGGRWNSPGLRCVYTSGNRSLAVLEVVVHSENERPIVPWVICGAVIPDSVRMEHLAAESLPPDWRAGEAPAGLAVIGDTWLRELRSPVLIVPSAMEPSELNYLLNPVQPDFGEIQVLTPEPYTFDERLFPR